MPRYTQSDHDERAQAVRLVRAGLSFARVGAICGRSPNTVWLWARADGFRREPRPEPVERQGEVITWTTRDLADALRWRAQGVTHAEVAYRLGRSAAAVRRYLSRHHSRIGRDK